jgi:hypothetical protein
LEDETVCIAIVLGKDPETVLDAPKPERMSVLYDILGDIPKPFPTLSGDSMKKDGYRWAPKSSWVQKPRISL